MYRGIGKNKEVCIMPGGDGKGPVGGRGTGCGGGARRAGFAGGARMRVRGAGPSAEAVCPQCGAKAPHEPGIPCFQQKCPKCGSTMARG